MVFKCQEDSFMKEFTSKVVSCEKAEFTALVNGKKASITGYETILEDTILFPEGGGQPSDHGFLNGLKVYQVVRRADKAVHFTDHPLTVGEQAKQTIDWERRFDHMQQHSGQHLITAVLDREFKFNTVSWYLGEEVAYVELETPSIEQEQIDKAETICNELIRDNVRVKVDVFAESTPQQDLDDYRSPRGLPVDHKGDIRVVTIEGIESNMCCGTHVKSLSQLQVVKLLHSEKSKRKDQILLYFLVGNRVINRLHNCIKREEKLTSLLKTNPVDHPEFVDKLIQSSKTSSKNLKNVLKELAVFEAERLKVSGNGKKYYMLHKKEAEPDFMSVFIKEFGTTDIFLVLSVGDDKGDGNIMIHGEEKAVADLGPRICDLLGGKGAGKGNRFQAKVTNMSKKKEVDKLLNTYFSS